MHHLRTESFFGIVTESYKAANREYIAVAHTNFQIKI